MYNIYEKLQWLEEPEGEVQTLTHVVGDAESVAEAEKKIHVLSRGLDQDKYVAISYEIYEEENGEEIFILSEKMK